MNVDISIPKTETADGLFTLMPSLSEEEIASRNPNWYTKEAIRYNEGMLIDDENTGLKALDPQLRYITMDADEAAEKYIDLFYNSKDMQTQKEAYAICYLLMRVVFYMNSETHFKLKKIADKLSTEVSLGAEIAP